MAYPTGSYEHITYGPSINLEQSSQIGQHNQAFGDSDPNSMNSYLDVGDLSLDDNSYGFFVKRNGTEENSNGEYYGASTSDENYHIYRSCKGEINGEGSDRKVVSSLSSVDSEYLETIKASVNEPVDDSYINGTESPVYESSEVESLVSENNAELWSIPPPEDEDADIDADLSEDRESDPFDDEDDGDAAGEWGYQSSSSSVAGGELQQREKANEENRRALINKVRGHLRALITQLLQGLNLPFQDDYVKDCWLDIITNLSWDAAILLKPDMTKGSGMDPCGYVKVKCLACGKRSDSVVIKGVVCKKNVAHRRMTAKFDRPRLLILGGALEYQRVSNHLSSFDTLLQQEMDHLKMAVTKISAHNPNILLVEKSVSRFAQEYLLEKNISLVLNIKRPLLERIARCTGAEILPSFDSSQSLSVKKIPILGRCDSFHVEKFFEEHGSADQGGKKLTKTLMFFEGCPKPLGCTILLKGAPGDELKKVKDVVQWGIFAAYQLALETSYLADERIMPESSLKSPIHVALPDKSNINRSISTVSDLVTPTSERLLNENSQLISQINSSISTNTVPMSERCQTGSMMTYNDSLSSSMQSSVGDSSRSSSYEVPNNMFNDLSQNSFSEFTSKIGVNQFPESHITSMNLDKCLHDDYAAANRFNMSGSFGHNVGITNNDGNALTEHDPSYPGNVSDSNSRDLHENVQPLKSPPADGQSILVSLTTRCVLKGVVCERAHLFRIKYYHNFDKPLGRFLQDDLFDQSYLCRVCEMPPEAHIHCYTHQQGSLTISVRRNLEHPLPGESKGKIWMWHRCCRCPRDEKGCPPATGRVPMSDAAWGLSFGKFLELSFSNHAAASRVASCGHSLHKDCLRFYGCGWMVACFRYAPIIVHSVYLPPSKLEFTCTNLEWIEIEANEVRNQAGELYDKVCNAINEISDKYLRSGLLESSTKACGLRKHITELETKLKEEKEYFEESLKRAFERQAGIDILEINKLRRRLLIDSYKWDQILIDTDAKITQYGSDKEETPNGVEKTNMDGEPAKEVGSCGSIISDGKIEINNGQGPNIKHSSEQDSCSGNIILDQETMCKEKGDVMPNGVNMGEADPVNSNNSVRRVISAGQLPIVGNLSVTIESAWIGERHSGSVKPNENDTRFSSEKHIDARDEMDIHRASSLALPPKSADSVSNSTSWLKVPFINIYQSPEKSTSLNAQKLDAIGHYNPKFVTSFRELVCPGGARLLLSVGFDNTVVPVYDDEPTSIIAYALVSPEYQTQMSDDPETKKDGIESTISLHSINSVNSLSEAVYGPMRSFGSSEESLLPMAGCRSSLNLDPLFYTKALHARVHFSDNGPLGKVNYTVTCYYAKRFEALRKISCPTEMDFIRSLSRCKKWGAQGGKSNVFFAKTLDDRFIIKQVTKTELESFIKFAPAYFKYLSESINSSSPTCLAKILGIYQVTSKHMKGGRESKMDVLVMENLLFRRNVKILYDLKGSCRSRYNPNSSGGNNVLLDQNLLETMCTSPIFVGNKAKRLLERAVWNDTSFLASIDVMDYSLLVGIDEEKRELVVGIIDFMRQYTWDKHLETWVKASGILGGPKNAQPTVISPDQYKKRFRKAMTTYFLMVPDQWNPPTIIPAESPDPSEENSKILASP